VGPAAGVDECGKSRLHRHSIPGPSSPLRHVIPTELSRPAYYYYYYYYLVCQLSQNQYFRDLQHLWLELLQTLPSVRCWQSPRDRTLHNAIVKAPGADTAASNSSARQSDNLMRLLLLQ
jgi:hypothetical protein